MRKRFEALQDGYKNINARKEPLVNKFVKFCNSAKLKFLMQGLVVWLIGSSVLISYIFVSRGCIDASVTMTNCVLLVLAMLLGGSGPDISQTGCCPTMNIVATLISFATDSLLIAVFVSRITSPKTIIRVSDVMILKMRNSRLLFQIRMMNEFGHPMENVSVKAAMYKSSVSEEGEIFMGIFPVYFEQNYVCHAPQNISHFIDETSPLYGEELDGFAYDIEVTVSAKDSVLDVHTSVTKIYDKSSMRIAHEWETVFVKTFSDVGDDGNILVDNSKISLSGPLSPEIELKIKDAFAWNKYNLEKYGTAYPSVLKALTGTSVSKAGADNRDPLLYESSLNIGSKRGHAYPDQGSLSNGVTVPSSAGMESVSTSVSDGGSEKKKKKSKFQSVFGRR